MALQRKSTMGKGAVVSCLSKYIHPSMWVRDHYLKMAKGHRLKRMKVQQRELKKIRGKEVMAIAVTAPPRTVDDGGTIELYALKNHF